MQFVVIYTNIFIMIQRSLLFVAFLSLACVGNAQFRSLNSAFLTSIENVSFMVSPIDYNKVTAFGSSLGNISLYGQRNINRLYSAVGGQVTRFSTNEVAVSLRAASHSLMTRNNYHVALGGELTYYSGISNQLSWNLGVMGMSRTIGGAAFGLTYSNFEYVTGTFSSTLRRQSEVVAGFVGYSIALTRKMKFSQSLNYKSFLEGDSRSTVAQYGASLVGRRYAFGSGIRKFDAVHYAAIVRLGWNYRRLMFGYVGVLDQQHLAINKWTNEVSLVIKL